LNRLGATPNRDNLALAINQSRAQRGPSIGKPTLWEETGDTRLELSFFEFCALRLGNLETAIELVFYLVEPTP
jgi:hypothetical protein